MRRPSAILLLAVVVAGCAVGERASPSATDRASTRYEVWRWSVSIPDDLGVRPANDPEAIWREGPLLITADDGSARTLSIHVQALADRSTTVTTALELLESVAAEADAEEVGEVTPRTFPIGEGATVHAIRNGLALDIVYIVHGEDLVTVIGSELTLPDVLVVADSFRFRDPPGDPEEPPSSSPGA